MTSPSESPERSHGSVGVAPRRLRSDLVWSMAMYCSRALASLVWVIAASRSLGSAQFGELAAISAMTSLTSVVASGGLGHAITQACARRPDLARRTLARGDHVFWGMAALALGACLALGAASRSVSVWGLLIMLLSDVVVAGRFDLAGSALVGVGRFRVAAQLAVVWGSARVVAAAIVLALPVDSLVVAAAIAAGCAAPTLVAVSLVTRSLPRAGESPARPGALMRASTPFAVGNLVARGTNDADKIILNATLSPSPQVGSYAVAYRIVDFALLPLVSVSAAVYPRMFRAGADGLQGARSLAKRIRWVYAGVGLLTSLVVLCATPVATALFGDQYVDLGAMMLSLAFLPTLRVGSMLLGEPLSGSGRQSWRVVAGSAALATNVGVNLVFVAEFGWKSAMVASYLAEVVQIVVLVLMHRSLASTDRHLCQPSSA